MSLTKRLAHIDFSTFDIVSTDIFDTILLRDLSSERKRFDEAARSAAVKLNLDATRLSTLRQSFHRVAYSAVEAERPLGDASLDMICRVTAAAMGASEGAATTLREIEVDTDIRHLATNGPLLDVYTALAATGKRLIATTDTYYSAICIQHILDTVIGPYPISHIYSSSDMGLTKHAGKLFGEVARREGACPSKILHLGDDWNADVHQARAAGWKAVHLPRAVVWRRLAKLALGTQNIHLNRRP